MPTELSLSPRARSASLGARWGALARSVGLDPSAPALIALSGGADSVFLLHAAASAPERPRLVVVHVDHGLRGAESDADARFCEELCAGLALPCVTRRVELDPRASGLEARARAARYAVLAEEARAAGIDTILTAHHADDALETLLLRWTRGSDAAGLAGLRARQIWRAADGRELVLARPLLALGRDELRARLTELGLAWREDSSNGSTLFARNRVRGGLLPQLVELGGAAALESLRSFAGAAAELEEHCARFTSAFAWSEARFPLARARGAGRLARTELAQLSAPLARRVLARLFAERTGAIPSHAGLERLLAALRDGSMLRSSLPGGWSVRLSAIELALDPPPPPAWPHFEAALRPGTPLALPCGRALGCAWVDRSPAQVPPHAEGVVELAADDLARDPGFHVRYARPADRFHGLGASGSKRLARFLQDAGIPARERGTVPLVLRGDEIVWVAGIRPAEARAVRAGTFARVRLSLDRPGDAEGTLRAAATVTSSPHTGTL